MTQPAQARFALAFDTSNEVIAIGLGRLDEAAHRIDAVASVQVKAHRASNTRLLPLVDALCADNGVERADIACVAVGRGPGSFTGVRIAMATAKGIAGALEAALVGISSLDAVAWNAWNEGRRGDMLVIADAMRKEVYPARFALDGEGVVRLSPDHVVKVADFSEEHVSERASSGQLVTGDALAKYADVLAPFGTLLEEDLWSPTGAGLLLALQAAWRRGDADPFDARRHLPAFVLPVYTRLSDAEENERARLARDGRKPARDSRHVTMNDTAVSNARANEEGIVCKPLDHAHAAAVAAMESRVMGSDRWSEALVVDELGRADRSWWAAYAADPMMPLPADAPLVGYAGCLVVDGEAQILKVGVDPARRRRGIACELLAHVADDARNLGAETCMLEVRASNEDAQAFYRALGFEEAGTRPGYYSDKEDAVLMAGSIVCVLGEAQAHAAEGRVRRCDEASARPASGGGGAKPLILAIETSCDETAAAVVDGEGALLADVVASQVDFHARFGGVVPEIASRKHVEAICGVCDECLEVAARGAGVGRLRWRDLDAVAATYTPGLVGALVVGVAFAKGAAWAAGIPFIGVNHLEGHLYANKLGDASFAPPAVVSLVSGGNTMLVHMRDWGDYVTLGATIDDAVGEAFDKVAKALGLGYPGGPAISFYAARGDPGAIAFPRAMMHSGDMRFSLSGLKTAVVGYINEQRAAGLDPDIADIAAGFQQAVIDVQVSKTRQALEQTGAPTFCLGGGVAANPALRAAYEDLCADLGVRLVMPPPRSCGDNAGMIALVALDRYRQGKFFGLEADALSHADLDEAY